MAQRTITVLMMLLLLCSIRPAFSAEQVFYYHTDPVGTPLSMTDSTGNVVWKADYKPFGEEYTTTGTANNSKRFVGKEKDEETGLSYFGARYEDARTGRFTAVDPVRVVDPMTSKTNEKNLLNPQRLNVYVYALNNPYRYVDPDGRDIMVIENGPTSGLFEYVKTRDGNPIGHTAGAVVGAGLSSFGNSTDLGSSVADYLWRESKKRDTTIYVIHTSAKQDAAALEYLKQYGSSKLPSGMFNSYFADNCSTRINGTLNAAGIPYISNIDTANIPGTAGSRALAVGADVYKIPKGSKTLPAVVGRFEPYKR